MMAIMTAKILLFLIWIANWRRRAQLSTNEKCRMSPAGLSAEFFLRRLSCCTHFHSRDSNDKITVLDRCIWCHFLLSCRRHQNLRGLYMSLWQKKSIASKSARYI
ncbi:hypothetical protein CPB84DRAFT_1763682, partial [Gymnopilus junonius]